MAADEAILQGRTPNRAHAPAQAAPRASAAQRATGPSIPCGACGGAVAPTDLLFSDAGGLCPGCFGEAHAPGRVSRWPALLATGGGATIVSGLALGFVSLASIDGTVGSDLGVTWSLLTSTLACVGAFLTLRAARQVRELSVCTPPEERDASFQAQRGIGGVIAAGSALSTLALAACTLLPSLL